MGATDAQKTRFRRKLDGDETSMPDPYIDDIFDEAAETYAGFDDRVIVAYAYIIGIRDMKMRASRLTDYVQNATEDKRSQIKANLDKLEKDYQTELDNLIEATTAAPVFFGRPRVVPKRWKEYPDA